MPAVREKNRFPVSLHYTPTGPHARVFYTVLRAGHVIAGKEHHISRERYPGHELILCLEGVGHAVVRGRETAVRAGELLWIDCSKPHEYRADERDPWEVFWLRMEGAGLDRICKMLSAGPMPLGVPAKPAADCFRRIFATMAQSSPEALAAIHAEAAQLIALCFRARSRGPGDSPLPQNLPALLRRPLEQMRSSFERPWRVAELAGMAGMSPSHFIRTFRAALGTSPIDWLRRERINQAKRRLVETDDSMKEIARLVGYSDQFFFSKDFKQMTSLTPTDYRKREKGLK